MSKSKVIIPEYVAKAIEALRGQGYSNYGVLSQIKGAVISPLFKKANEWTKGDEGSTDLLMQALVNGYEVEKTPEEELREYYENNRISFIYDDEDECIRKYGKQDGVRTALRILGITIEGINGEDD